MAPTGRHPLRFDRKPLRVLVAVAAVNGAVCIIPPVFIVLDPGGAGTPRGSLAYLAALLTLVLTPIQLGVLAGVLRGPVREMMERRRAQLLVEKVVTGGLVQSAFQPIVHLASRQVMGVEALARFTTEPPTPPDVLFALADRVGRGVELELLAIRTHMTAAAHLPDHLYVAVNASPVALLSPGLLPALLGTGIAPTRIVVELTEHACVADYPALLCARETLRLHGIRLAVDDAGSGYSTFRHIVAVGPDIIKVDRSLIEGIDHDDACRAMVGSLVLYALESGSLVVGEGVETAAELETLEQLGVDAVQGFLLGRPRTGDAAWGSPPVVPQPGGQALSARERLARWPR